MNSENILKEFSSGSFRRSARLPCLPEFARVGPPVEVRAHPVEKEGVDVGSVHLRNVPNGLFGRSGRCKRHTEQRPERKRSFRMITGTRADDL